MKLHYLSWQRERLVGGHLMTIQISEYIVMRIYLFFFFFLVKLGVPSVFRIVNLKYSFVQLL